MGRGDPATLSAGKAIKTDQKGNREKPKQRRLGIMRACEKETQQTKRQDQGHPETPPPGNPYRFGLLDIRKSAHHEHRPEIELRFIAKVIHARKKALTCTSIHTPHCSSTRQAP